METENVDERDEDQDKGGEWGDGRKAGRAVVSGPQRSGVVLHSSQQHCTSGLKLEQENSQERSPRL